MWSPTARIEGAHSDRAASASTGDRSNLDIMLLPSSLVPSLGGRPESVSHCARSTRGVRDRALREQGRPIRPPAPSY